MMSFKHQMPLRWVGLGATLLILADLMAGVVCTAGPACSMTHARGIVPTCDSCPAEAARPCCDSGVIGCESTLAVESTRPAIAAANHEGQGHASTAPAPSPGAHSARSVPISGTGDPPPPDVVWRAHPTRAPPLFA